MSSKRVSQNFRLSRNTLLVVPTLVAGILLACSNRSPNSSPKFKVNVEDTAGSRVCEVVFNGRLPSPEAVDKIVREALEKAVEKDPSRDILATAFLGDETLTSNQYSGMLVYKASEKRIMTLSEYEGVKTSTSSTSSYFVEIEELKTYPGITPAKRWLSLTIVFPTTPSREVAYDATLTEIQKVRGRGFDIDAYVSVGDRNRKTSWYQMRDNDGAFVFAEYESATKKVTRKGQIVKQLH